MSAPIRHVWVRPAFAIVDYPGLLLDWRDGEKGREFLQLRRRVPGAHGLVDR